MSNDLLRAEKRTLVGKNAVKKVRSAHYIPGILYGHHIDNVNIKVLDHDLDKFLKKHGRGASLDLEVEGEKKFVLFKEMQIDRLKNIVTHVEFQALSAGEKIRVRVPVHYTGKDKIPAGIIFNELHHEVVMNVLPKDLIEDIVIDVSKAQLGSHFTIGQLDIFHDQTHEILDDPDTLLYSLSEPTNVPEVEEAEEETSEAAEVPEIGKEE